MMLWYYNSVNHHDISHYCKTTLSTASMLLKNLGILPLHLIGEMIFRTNTDKKHFNLFSVVQLRWYYLIVKTPETNNMWCGSQNCRKVYSEFWFICVIDNFLVFSQHQFDSKHVISSPIWYKKCLFSLCSFF